ncbi:MAG: AAA family ATPase, partial [Anaerolineales bacterium]|nr:AAA family ATPase [Anaerolineales bacterium]
TGQTSLVLLEGDAGMGKSQLLSLLKQLAFERNIGTLSGTGNSIERAASYHGWRGVFGQMFDINILADLEAQKQLFLELIDFYEPETLPLVPLLNPVLPFNFADTAVTTHLSGQARADNTRNLLIQLIQTSMNRSPKIVILDDAHWLDSASWSLALAAVRRVKSMLLIIATRPLTRPLPHAYRELLRLPQTTHLEIGPMPPSDLIDLVCNRLQVQTLPPEISQLILDRAQGNPFFCEEMAYALRDTGDLIVEQGTVRLSKSYNAYETSMPTTVQGIITSRIDRLTPAQQLTLKVASVIGRLFPFGTLRDVYPIAADRLKLEDHLLELERQSLTAVESIEPELAYGFTHVITQEVAYNLLLYEQRRQLHERVADWYESVYLGYVNHEERLLNADGGVITVEKKPIEENSFIIPLLVHHHHHAHNEEKERHYALLAAQQAARQFANTEAVSYYSRVLELTPKDKKRERYDILVAREQIYHLLGQRTAQDRDLFDLALLAEDLNDDRSRAWVALRRAVYELATSQYQQAVDTAQIAMTLASMLEEHAMEAEGYLQWGLALLALGEYDQTVVQLEKANYQARLLGERELEAASLQSMGQVFHVQGDASKARGYFMQALMIRREIGDKRGEARGLNNIGRVLLLQGELEKARSYLE